MEMGQELDRVELEEDLNLSTWLLQNRATTCCVSVQCSSPTTTTEYGTRHLTVEASALIDGTFYVETDLAKLTDAIQDNTNTEIVELCLDGDWSGRGLSSCGQDDLIGLLRLLSDNDALEGLTLEGGRGDAAILSLLVHFARNLEIIEFYDVFLEGDEDSFQALAASLKAHGNLKQVNSFYLKIDKDIFASAKMDLLLTALLETPAIESLGIWTTPNPEEPLFSTATLLQACSSTKLTTLQLIGVLTEWNLQEDAVTHMAQRLGTNQVLKCLQLGLDLDAAACSALALLIQANTSLESIRIDPTQDPTTIRRHQDAIVQLAHALQHNNSLTKFKLVAEMNAVQLDNQVLKAYESVLQTNYTLQDLVLLDYGDKDQRETIDFLLNLNRNNRQQVLLDAFDDTEEWLEAIGKHRGDLDSLVYHLSMNPSIFAAFA